MNFYHIQSSRAELTKHSLVFRCNISWDIDVADDNDDDDDDEDEDYDYDDDEDDDDDDDDDDAPGCPYCG